MRELCDVFEVFFSNNMAYNYMAVSSDDENENESFCDEKFPGPYQFEPYESDDSDTEVDSVERHADQEDRLNTSSWCKCGNCAYGIRQTVKECVCCHEIPEMQKLMEEVEGGTCILHHPGFESVCLDIYVLRTAYLQYKQQYGQAITDMNNRHRYTAYRQLARFAWGILGKNIRVVLPACAVSKIRQTFPSNNGVYTGYLEPETV